MLTVKLMKATTRECGTNDTPAATTFSTKIVEGIEVDVHTLRHGELSEVVVKHAGGEGSACSAFYVADRAKGRPAGFADEVDFYYAAFIENAHGSTTETVRF